MTAVHKEIMTRYRADGIFMNRWDGSGDLLLRALPGELQGGDAGWSCRGRRMPRIRCSGPGSTGGRQRLLELLDVWNGDDPRDQSGVERACRTTAAGR